MKKIITIAATLAAMLLTLPVTVQASPQQDLKNFRQFFEQRFPDTPFKDFANGALAKGIGTADMISQWQDMMQFPPFDFELAKGKKLFETPFPNGKTYASCFKNGGINIRQYYPYVDNKTGQVHTLESDINSCRVKNGLKPLGWKKGDIADISAYMASTSDGQPLQVKTPTTPAELAAYHRGKAFFYAKRGQLNMACADCHMVHAGQWIRAEILSPALGQPTGFPTYRAKWGALGTLHRRFAGCNNNIRAKPFKAQSAQYKDLEYFLTYMSNGEPVNAPAYRK